MFFHVLYFIALPPKHVQESLYVLPKYKLAMCVPSKNGCALTAGIFSELNPKFDGPFWTASFPSTFNITNVQETIYQSPEWTKVMIVRHPVERVKSAWRSKCGDTKERKASRCKAIFGTRSTILSDAVESMLTKPRETRDRHVHHQVDFCFGISDYVSKGTVQVYQHSSDLFQNIVESILLHVGVPNDQIQRATETANTIITEKYGNHITENPAVLLSQSLEKRIIEDYQIDIDTFHILPQPQINVLVAAMNQFEIVKENLESLWKFYFVTAYVVDDGPKDLSAEYKEYCFARPCTYRYVGFDRGLSFKRNRLAELAQTDLVFFSDADTIWTLASDLLSAATILSNGASIVGFSYTNKKKFYGELWVNDEGRLCLCNKEKRPWEDHNLGCFQSDVSLNQFLTTRQFALSHPWNETLKVYEHGHYFYTIKKTSRATVIYCTDLLLEHNKKEPREQWYKRLRRRKDVYRTKTRLRCPSN